MYSQKLPYVELALLTVGDTDGLKIKELTLPFDVLLEVLGAVPLLAAFALKAS